MTGAQGEDGRGEVVGKDFVRGRIDIAQLRSVCQSLGEGFGQVRCKTLEQLVGNGGRLYKRGCFAEGEYSVKLW